jgi:hypothetical protein
LDFWLGKESVQFFEEDNIKLFIRKHMEGHDNEIDHIEGTGAINFLSLDDMRVVQEGEVLHAESILQFESSGGELIFPAYVNHPDDPFIQKLNKSGEKWIILTDEKKEPKLALDADGFLRSDLIYKQGEGIKKYCHVPIIIRDENANLGNLLKKIRNNIDIYSDKPIEKDVVFIWGKEEKRIITGADILGRLLKGI